MARVILRQGIILANMLFTQAFPQYIAGELLYEH